jgi:hypothetical protein
MQWFMAHSTNAVSRERDLGIHFQGLVPCRLIPGTALGHQAAAAYAAIEGVSVDELVVQRHVNGVAYGFRNDSDILPLDV